MAVAPKAWTTATTGSNIWCQIIASQTAATSTWVSNSIPTYATTSAQHHAIAMAQMQNQMAQAQAMGFQHGRNPPRPNGALILPEDVIPEDWDGLLHLPDGGRLVGDGKGNVTIEGKDAKIRYRAATRDFNRYINASDLLEEFIEFVGKAGARSDEVLDLPLNLFITFLIIRAAEADGEEPPANTRLVLPPPRRLHRCRGCGRFMAPRLAIAGVNHCSPAHLDLHMRRLTA